MDYKIKSRIWIEVDGHVLLGEGRVKLLKEIANQGSLSKAAKTMNISYKKAWNMIDAINKSAKEPVISTSIGGKGGGGALLTSYGNKLIEIFDEINMNCWSFLDQQSNKMADL